MGGFLGSVLRYSISVFCTKRFGSSFPVGTLIVNVAGGLLMGFIMQGSMSIWDMPANLRIFMTTGILGGLTTFSTFSYETVSFFTEGEYLMGGLNACLNLFLALIGVFAGKCIAQLF
jgi:CrcB protein